MVGLLAVARSITALGREHFLPPVAAWVHHKTQTPIITTAVLGVVTGALPPICGSLLHFKP
jgi:amino acid transporter